MGEFLSADAPCFALGMVEERKRRCGFLALRPEEAIPPEVTGAGFSFGRCLFGNAAFEVVQFSFHFYGFKTYNVLVQSQQPNPTMPEILWRVCFTIVRSVAPASAADVARPTRSE